MVARGFKKIARAVAAKCRGFGTEPFALLNYHLLQARALVLDAVG